MATIENGDAESLGEAVRRAVANGAELASIAAKVSGRAARAYALGEDAEGHARFGELCGLLEDLSSLARAANASAAGRATAARFLASWQGDCAAAFAELVQAREASDFTLLADHLGAHTRAALEGLAAAGWEDGRLGE
jgi:hypothetical protein